MTEQEIKMETRETKKLMNALATIAGETESTKVWARANEMLEKEMNVLKILEEMKPE